MQFEYSIPGTFKHGISDTVEDAEANLGVENYKYTAVSPDERTTYYYRTQEELDDDKDGAYAPQISLYPENNGYEEEDIQAYLEGKEYDDEIEAEVSEARDEALGWEYDNKHGE